MLTRIRINSIQKHKSLTLNLDKINVITGATDTGKTSVLRGLLWCLTNNESGENLVNNDGATACSVTVTADGHEIERSWSKSKNAYRLDDKTFTTFRTSVPEPIAKLLNITDLNVQERRDLPFMVYYKASECANQFSEMLDLEEIDSTIANINRAVKAKTEMFLSLRNTLTGLKACMQKYESIDDAVEAFERIEQLSKDIADSETTLNKLTSLCDSVQSAVKAKDSYINPTEAVEQLSSIETLFSEYVKANAECKRLEALYIGHTSACDDVVTLAKANEAKKAFSDIVTLARDLKAIVDRGHMLTDMIEQYKRMSKFVDAEKMNYDKVHSKFVQNFPEVCPLCGGTDHEF